ncbi:MAG: ribosome biogenesis GTPase Der [Phycisphaerales bacterium]|nr:ribosome biogenesis GTPase Der [Phycisphaerales bacterium]
MSLPRVAIVGRPNVGKSSILNMLARAKVSIVDPTPGVTRDRVTVVVELDGPTMTEPRRLAEVVDTGGFGVYTADYARFDDAGEDLHTLTNQIEAQITAAVDQADLILFVIDSQDGITTLDETVAELLRKRVTGKGNRNIPVQVVANKVDSERWEPHAYEAAALGFGEPLLLGAKNNFHRRHFLDALYAMLPETATQRDPDPEMRVALVGRRNAGKSSFVNALAGEPRCIVSEIAGTTRDAIDVKFEIDGRSMVAIDTAGVRKRSKFADRVEHWAFERCQQAIVRADCVLLLIDSTQKITAVDKRLGAAVLDQFKPCVIVVTKWDLADGRKNKQGKVVTIEDYQKYIEKELPGMSFCPIVFTSAAESVGLREAMSTAYKLFEQAQQRITTSKMNDMMREILAERGPTSKLGTKVKILYTTQVRITPPTILLVVNHPDLFTDDYQRYMLNRLRERVPFDEVPIRLIIRERQRAELDDLLSGRHKREREAQQAAALLVDEHNAPIEIDLGDDDDDSEDLMIDT